MEVDVKILAGQSKFSEYSYLDQLLRTNLVQPATKLMATQANIWKSFAV